MSNPRNDHPKCGTCPHLTDEWDGPGEKPRHFISGNWYDSVWACKRHRIAIGEFAPDLFYCADHPDLRDDNGLPANVTLEDLIDAMYRGDL